MTNSSAAERSNASAAQLLAVLNTLRRPEQAETWVTSAQPHAAFSVSPDYANGILDLLTAMGVLDDSSQASSPNAYYFVRSLAALIQDGTLTSAVWQGAPTEGCSGAGARLLRHFEEMRLRCTNNPTPLRVVRASVAVIKARSTAGDVYLMQYDQKAERFQPIGGKQEALDADGKAAMVRELCEELEVDAVAGRDFQCYPLRINAEAHELSATLHVLTQYFHSFYHITDIAFPIVANGHNQTRWLNYSEILAGSTYDGYAITSLYQQYLAGMLPQLAYSVQHIIELP
jgi:8-oxo-dGTP pyrophosphatase MutT (NUDIX family)